MDPGKSSNIFSNNNISGLNDLTPKQVLNINSKFIEETGLKKSLTPSRSNGFLNILLKMQSQANNFLT